jgi:alkylation response protein AidB-like acyl-CoA dehydrogenase
MHSPGIEIRPIRTIDNSDDFCEVFYDEVHIPLSNVVGGMHNGWSVAMSTLSFERGTAFTIDQVQLSSTVERLIELARDRSMLGDDEIAHSLARARADVAALRALTYLGISRNLHSAEPGPEGSMLKLHWADLYKRIMRLAVEILGPASLSFEVDGDIWSELFLLSYGISIGGGTSEIQRNIIAERVLGLPR